MEIQCQIGVDEIENMLCWKLSISIWWNRTRFSGLLKFYSYFCDKDEGQFFSKLITQISSFGEKYQPHTFFYLHENIWNRFFDSIHKRPKNELEWLIDRKRFIWRDPCDELHFILFTDNTVKWKILARQGDRR